MSCKHSYKYMTSSFEFATRGSKALYLKRTEKHTICEITCKVNWSLYRLSHTFLYVPVGPVVHPHASIHTFSLTRQQMLCLVATVSLPLNNAMNVSPFFKQICQHLNHRSRTRHSGHRTDGCPSGFI